MSVPDKGKDMEGFIPPTRWAKPHRSGFSRTNYKSLDGLQNMNCCYTSTPGVPPTLEALKQHAQSLVNLITFFEPEIDASVHLSHSNPTDKEKQARENKRVTEQANALDWLRTLGKPYKSDNPAYKQPLVSLLNEIKAWDELKGSKWQCPLETFVIEDKPKEKNDDDEHVKLYTKPYAKHHLLLMHANACLERLDHEYSFTGGLMSLLPIGPRAEKPVDPNDMDVDFDEGESAEMLAARNTLVGQWLMYTQQLVGRMHELEILYGNCADALASEAAIPLQHLSARGPDLRSFNEHGGREIAFKQDRWVMVNSGDDVFKHIHGMLDRQEAIMEEKDRIWRGNGASNGGVLLSDRLWEKSEDREGYARGIVAVNAQTRFYRIKGKGHGTIFVLPAWEVHPGVSGTRDMEERPTVVSVVAPRYPIRVSDLEKRYDERLKEAGKIEEQIGRRIHEDHKRELDLQTLKQDNEYKNTYIGKLEDAVDKPIRELQEAAARREHEWKREKEEVEKKWRKAEEKERKLEGWEKELKEAHDKATELEDEKDKLNTEISNLKAKLQAAEQ